ncbi:hypothetical protein GSI_07686 [Ganoderma sinense ZZ0214-1]|uniref:Uncharacterized protein n=1 Tax=Ganoderma sinense ZZ0214-1 TaxID=1077348 RepID=A0A2G8S8K8_9APHY|nr:hypothetical protein GSI_07686 [Ganoderma sinense ZZ0214-1]
MARAGSRRQKLERWRFDVPSTPKLALSEGLAHLIQLLPSSSRPTFMSSESSESSGEPDSEHGHRHVQGQLLYPAPDKVVDDSHVGRQDRGARGDTFPCGPRNARPPSRRHAPLFLSRPGCQ